MITVYWSPVVNASTTQEFVSELKYFDPTPVYKSINAKEFFGLGASLCPAMIDETKNTYQIKSPIDFHIKFDHIKQQIMSNYDVDPNFLIRYVGEPNEENIHQLEHPNLLFFCEDNLTMTQTHPYYEETQFSESTMGLAGTYNISNWVRPVRPAFKFKTGRNELDIKKGDTLCYFKFNTSEKVKLVRFDSTKLFESENNIVMHCLGYKNLKVKRLIPTPLAECYEAFKNARYKNRMINYIKENKV
tara:strand:+ start:428 stop:1162 length:735 start_codon:yes stop_codon:yes gene_type:complete